MAKAGKRSNADADLDPKKMKKSKSSRTSQQTARIDDMPDSEEDPGHSMSVQFLATARETTKRSNTAVANFTKAMEGQKQTLCSLFDQSALKTTARNTQFQVSLTTLLATSQRQHSEKTTTGVKESTSTKSAAHSIFNNAKSGIALSRQLLEHYDRVCQQVTSGDSTLRTDSSWEDGRQTLQRVLDRQAEKTRLEVYHLLHDSSKSVKEKFDDATLLEDNDLWNRFAVSNSKQEGGKVDRNGVEGWGVTAKRAGKSVQHMVKHLPEDSE